MRSKLAKMSDAELVEFIATAETGWDWRYRMHVDRFGIIDDDFTVSWVSSIDSHGLSRGRLMVYYVVRYSIAAFGITRGSVALAKFPYFRQVPRTVDIERLTDAGYAVMEQRRSIAKAENAERNARLAAEQAAKEQQKEAVSR